MDHWSHALDLYAESARTSLGFFWKAGWAFVLGYAMSAMIQAFVPRGRLAPLLGKGDVRGVSIATGLGAASSSCSFAALATARALVMKGADFVAAVAFMFASTNLVIELGVLIVIFLGWRFLAAELIGGLLLVVVSSLLMRFAVPRRWLDGARRRVEHGAPVGDDDFDWRQRLRSREGWTIVGERFVADWKMVWEEIVIGFTIAGVMAVAVPSAVWERLFLVDRAGGHPGPWLALENALLAPLVAALTFIGSMGNIPLATVLDANGVLFAGIMAFIYSDLVVPPLVVINARYYGWRVALAIAGVMYVSVVATALSLQALFAAIGIVPPSGGAAVKEVTRMAIDYTFWLNLAFAAVAVGLVGLSRLRPGRRDSGGTILRRVEPRSVVALSCALIVAGGLLTSLFV